MKTLKGPAEFSTRSGVGKLSCPTSGGIPTGVRWTHSVRLAAYPAGLITLRSVVQIDPPLPSSLSNYLNLHCASKEIWISFVGHSNGNVLVSRAETDVTSRVSTASIRFCEICGLFVGRRLEQPCHEVIRSHFKGLSSTAPNLTATDRIPKGLRRSPGIWAGANHAGQLQQTRSLEA